MIRDDDNIYVFHIGKAVQVGLYRDDVLLASGMGVLGMYNNAAGRHSLWFNTPRAGDDPDLQWFDADVTEVIVTWDDEARR